MRSGLFRLFVILACLFVGSCTSFKYPIAESKKENYDKRLIGSWKSTRNKNLVSHVFLHIGKYEKSKMNTVVVTRSKQLKRQNGNQIETIKANAYTAKISKYNFIIAEKKDELEEGEEPFNFFRYQFVGEDTLLIYPIDSCYLDALVKKGVLKGQVHESDKVCWAQNVVSRPSEILRIINDHQENKLFPVKYKFKRIKIP